MVGRQRLPSLHMVMFIFSPVVLMFPLLITHLLRVVQAFEVICPLSGALRWLIRLLVALDELCDGGCGTVIQTTLTQCAHTHTHPRSLFV